MDNEKKLGNCWKNYIQEKGLEIEFSALYAKEQNGAAEHSKGVILTKACCIRINA